jgi:hypothetical protein
MTNDDLLQQFKKLLEENNKQQDKNFQNRLEENNKQLRQEVREEIKAEVDPLHDRLDAQREQINNVEKNLRQEIKDSEKNIIEQFSPITNLVLDHDEKIAELQKAVGLRPKQ